MTRHTLNSYSYIHAPLHGYSLHRHHCYIYSPHECACMYCLYLLVITVHIIYIIVPCYSSMHVIWLFPVTDMDIPVTGHESCWYAICGIPHLLFPFPVILFPFPIILFYAINRAQVRLSCYPYHVLYLFLVHCIFYVGPKAYHPSFDDDQLMKLCLLMILCLLVTDLWSRS